MDYFDETACLWREPQIYKGLELHPLSIRDRKVYGIINWLLTINKDSITDKEIIKMSYLKFLTRIFPYMIKSENQSDTESFQNVLTNIKLMLSHIIRQEIELVEDLEKKKIYIQTEEKRYTENDFNKIRKIILKQNGISLKYIEDFNPELEKALVAFQDMNGKSNLNFKDLIFILSICFQKTTNELKDVTFYEFNNYVELFRDKAHFELYKPLELSGAIKFNKKSDSIGHWMKHISEKGRYDDILMSKKEFKEQNDVFKVAKEK